MGIIDKNAKTGKANAPVGHPTQNRRVTKPKCVGTGNKSLGRRRRHDSPNDKVARVHWPKNLEANGLENIIIIIFTPVVKIPGLKLKILLLLLLLYSRYQGSRGIWTEKLECENARSDT